MDEGVEKVLIFLMGAMAGQIVLIIGLQLWERWEQRDEPMEYLPEPEVINVRLVPQHHPGQMQIPDQMGVPDASE